MSDFPEDLKINSEKVNFFLKKYFKNQSVDSKLYEAMEYGLFSGGKMIRSYLIHATCKIFNVEEKHYIPIAAAVECVHSYSLIHDDLPSMDNDDFRRGKESTHKAFGEFTAILAGSSLLTMAFEMISDPTTNIDSDTKVKIIYSLSSCSGHHGIAGGQFYDLSFEKKNINQENIIDMQNKKTGALMGFCTEVATILAKKNEFNEQFKNIGIKLGLIFQIADDFLDKYGKADILGKPVQQDDSKGKNTLITHLGDQKTKELIQKLKLEIENDLKSFAQTDSLINCLNFMIERKN